MPATYVFDLTRRRRPKAIGGKAERLRFLIQRGFLVPTTLVCAWDAYLQYLDGDRQVLDLVRLELLKKLDPARSYAVRSSANVEDDPQYSFAGQFKTVLNVQGIDRLLDAIESIWIITQSPAV